MPSIAGFIQSLLSEDMYATGMLEKTDERSEGRNDLASTTPCHRLD